MKNLICNNNLDKNDLIDYYCILIEISKYRVLENLPKINVNGTSSLLNGTRLHCVLLRDNISVAIVCTHRMRDKEVSSR